LKVGSAMLALKEIEYFGEAQRGTVGERVERLVDRLLCPLEDEWAQGRHDGGVVRRVKVLRKAILADMAGRTLPEAEQVLRRKVTAALIVTEYPGQSGCVLVRVDEDDRDVGALEPWDDVLGRRKRDDEQAVGPLAKGQGLEVLVALLDRLDVVDDEIELAVRQRRVDAAESLGRLRSRQERGDDRDGLGLPQAESPGRETWGEVEFAGRLDDPLLCLLVDQGAVVEGSRDGRQADAGSLGNVSDRRALCHKTSHETGFM